MSTQPDNREPLLTRVAPEIATKVRVDAAKQRISASNLLQQFISEEYDNWVTKKGSPKEHQHDLR